MDRRLIWAVKAQGISNTRKKLEELSKEENLFDETTIDVKSDDYKLVEKSFYHARKTGTTILTYIDDLYPEKLRNISQPPPVLYVKGNAKILNDVVFVAVVGARDSDSYGIRTAEHIATEVG